VQARWAVLREGIGRRTQAQAGQVARRMVQEKSNAANLAAAEACWVRCRVDNLQTEALEVVLGVGIRMHKKAAAVEEADMMIDGDASGIVVGGSVAVETWKTQAAPRSPAWL